MTNSLKLQSKRRKNEYINRVVYPVYMLFWWEEMLTGRDKDRGKDINNLFYLLSQLLKL